VARKGRGLAEVDGQLGYVLPETAINKSGRRRKLSTKARLTLLILNVIGWSAWACLSFESLP